MSSDQPAGRAHWCSLDVTSESNWEKFVGEVRRQYGRLEVFVNNAGIEIIGSLRSRACRAGTKHRP
ncbi:SDR family NAD(P)-dependent oxidoreductase [Advenella incenata]|uniref:SDR family NAD(P)-dependent oxidoreductase n=1 Tax=Advenella incenata TaxID=267800 RepID=UPI003BF90187